MNELVGSVLLEADDYRSLLNEVKALKTALLRLKRELQEDVSVVSHGTVGLVLTSFVFATVPTSFVFASFNNSSNFFHTSSNFLHF